MFYSKTFRESNKDSAPAAKSGVRYGGQGRSDFAGGMTFSVRRGHLHALLLQIVIRVKYLLESWFLLKPLLSSSLSGYVSFLRPRGIPKLDWPTLFCLRLLWLVGGMHRAHPIFSRILVVSGLMNILGWVHRMLMVSYN